MKSEESLASINQEVIKCKKCPRLSNYVREVSVSKVKRFSNERYWGKPLPSFGDVNGELLIVGLAPAAHGGNRTGRMFTGDSSGEWLARALFNNGFATKPASNRLNDGFSLINCYVTAAVRCAPPQNKPTRDEIDTCSQYLKQELALMTSVKIVLCLGKIAFDTVLDILQIKKQKFAHDLVIPHGDQLILSSYHPSRQNTQTGRLTWKQWNSVFTEACNLLNKS